MKGRHFMFGILLLKYTENISSISVRHSDRGSVWNIDSLDLKYPARPAGVGRLSKHCKAFIFILALSVYSGCFHFFILSVEAGGTGRGEVRLPAPPRSSKYQNTSPSHSLSLAFLLLQLSEWYCLAISISSYHLSWYQYPTR